MDFITGLPPSGRRGKAYDALLVVVDRYSKMAKYIPCTAEIAAEELAQLLIEHVYSVFGAPESIISDRGSLFTSSYWSTLCHYLATKTRTSTAYHLQTDGATEMQNQTLETYLPCYINFHQDNWVD